jgi:hypothetical protein
MIVLIYKGDKMSTKGTIFLTDDNDHVYKETLDWSIVFEISKQNIESIKYRAMEQGTHDVFFGIIDIEQIEYIVIQTRENYNFVESLKIYAFDEENFYGCKKNKPNHLVFKLGEISLFETEKDIYIDKEKDIYTFWDVEIVIKKNTEWYSEYIKALKNSLKSRENHNKQILKMIEQ